MAKEKKFGEIVAEVYGLHGTGPIKYRVPVFLTVVPEVPEIILIKGKWAAKLISDNPLAYRLARTSRAKRVE